MASKKLAKRAGAGWGWLGLGWLGLGWLTRLILIFIKENTTNHSDVLWYAALRMLDLITVLQLHVL